MKIPIHPLLSRVLDRLWLKRVFNQIDQERVADACRRAEKLTSGEIRVAIRTRRSEGVQSLRDQAILDFRHLGMEATRDGTGVLILVCLQDRAFYVIADMAIGQKIGHQFWVMHTMLLSETFGSAHFTSALCHLVSDIGSLLEYDFPIRQDDTNELPNEPILLTGSERELVGNEFSWTIQN